MQENLIRYFICFCNEIQLQERVTLNIARFVTILNTPGEKYSQFVTDERGDCLKVSVENFGSFAYLSCTEMNPYIAYGADWKMYPKQRWPAENSCLYYIKIIPKSNFICFEMEGKIVAVNKKNKKPFEARLFLKRVSIRNDAPRLTFQKKAIRKLLYSRYFSFKNLTLLKKQVSHNLLSLCFPKGDQDYIQALLASNLNWNVSMKELRELTSFKEFLAIHFRNNQCGLRPTKTMLNYPLQLVHHLSEIKSPYNGAVILQALAPMNLAQLSIAHDFNPYKIFFRYKLLGTMENLELYTYIDDYVNMCKQLALEPNVRIRSVKRLIGEHDRVAKLVREKEIAPFKAPIPSVSEFSVNGFTFKHIANEKDLINESVTMKHCVASYAESVKSGQSVLFSVEGESERATLELRRSHYTKQYSVSQCKGKFNQTPSEQLMEVVQDILTVFPQSEIFPGETLSKPGLSSFVDNDHPF